MGGSVGEPGPLKQDDLSQAPPRSDGGRCLCSSADQRETGGGTWADPADPRDPASHLLHRNWILKISFRPVLKILWSHWLHQLFIRTWLLQVIWTQLLQILWSRIFQVLWSHWWFRLLLWLPKLWGFGLRNHLLCGLSAAAFDCCCSGSGPGRLKEELQRFSGRSQQGGRVCWRSSPV